MAPTFICGLDLGQLQDFSALAVIEQALADDGTRYATRYLHRWAPRTGYPSVVADVVDLLNREELAKAELVIDATGVGRPVVDLFRQTNLEERLVAVSITGGSVTNFEGGEWRVPKKELVGTMQALIGTRRWKIAEALKMAKVLSDELTTFSVKVNVATGNESFESWRERDHDDLVLACALACWWANRQQAVNDVPLEMLCLGPPTTIEGMNRYVAQTGRMPEV